MEKKVLVIGAAIADITGLASKAIIAQDSNPGRILISQGGVARNIAENLGRIGCHVDLITAFGDDMYGQVLKEHGQACGINMLHSLTSPAHATAIYLSINNPNGNMELALSDTSVLKEITPEFLTTKASSIENSDCIVLDTNLSKETLAYISEKYAHKALFIDPVSSTKALKMKPFLGSFHTIKPNLIEAEELSEMLYQKPDDLKIMLRGIVSQGVKQVFVSRGEEGCFYGDAHGFNTISSKRLKLVNSSGAGDAFMAGLVYGYLNDFNMKESATFATAMSEAALQSEAAVNPKLNLELIKQIIQEQAY